jgi:hypothetical protein
MSTDLALVLVALLLGLWALSKSRRASSAAERTAVAAEKSALAAERSAMAARRAAEAAEFSAVAARATAGGPDPAAAVATHAKATRLDGMVMDLVNSFPKEASAWPLIGRHPELIDTEVDEIIQKAFHLMGRTEFEAKQHALAVLNLRRDQATT